MKSCQPIKRLRDKKKKKKKKKIVTILFKIINVLVAIHTGQGEKWNSKEIVEYEVDSMETRRYLYFES